MAAMPPARSPLAHSIRPSSSWRLPSRLAGRRGVRRADTVRGHDGPAQETRGTAEGTRGRGRTGGQEQVRRVVTGPGPRPSRTCITAAVSSSARSSWNRRRLARIRARPASAARRCASSASRSLPAASSATRHGTGRHPAASRARPAAVPAPTADRVTPRPRRAARGRSPTSPPPVTRSLSIASRWPRW